MLLFAATLLACSQDKGEKADVQDAGEVQEVAGAEEYQVDVANSMVSWEGFKPAYSHNGTINLQSGSLQVEEGKLVGGNFVMDMNTITDLDLEDEEKRAMLEGHLKGTNEGQEDDFFNVRKFPTSTFEITKVTALEGDSTANHMIYGNLTMRDVTKQVGFKANVQMSDGSLRATTPTFNIDRTEWNVKHLSGSLFDLAAEQVISDDVALSITLVATEG